MNGKIKEYKFLFSELVKRDFKSKYKRTSLGMIWSVLHPLCEFLVMKLVFTHFFERTIPHYTIYLLSGQIMFSFFSESTNSGMQSLVSNASVISKIKLPKSIFLLSRNVSALINFLLTLLIFFVFVAFERLPVGLNYLTIIYPVFFLMIFNIGIGLILSALYVFFKDMKYLYSIFLRLLTYLSCIFYSPDSFPETIRELFLLNPVYAYIKFLRTVVIDGAFPDIKLYVLCAAYAIAALGVGVIIYRKYNHKFIFYL